MPKDLAARIRSVIEAGPDMRKPQNETGYLDIAFGRFVGYIEVGKHDITRAGVTTCEDRVRLVFEVSKVQHPSRNGEGPAPPYLVWIETTLGLWSGDRFFETFNQMNEAMGASHMAELLGGAFCFGVWHGCDNGRRSRTLLVGKEGYVVQPVFAEVAPVAARIRVFAWKTAEMDDWYDIHIPGEWNGLQKRVMSAKNWADHPLAKVAVLGGDPLAPSPQETKEEMQRRNCAELKAAVNRALAQTWREIDQSTTARRRTTATLNASTRGSGTGRNPHKT